ncbi:hypothetical protein [Mesorhizobium caraganae]|uniref:hypothetical protein n=1 Tax=Mesorhizobium caraganae TaxID=483206 RepID=UPI0017807BB8|nr:hypothetical protein [Mesorhizobium caraganae]
MKTKSIHASPKKKPRLNIDDGLVIQAIIEGNKLVDQSGKIVGRLGGRRGDVVKGFGGQITSQKGSVIVTDARGKKLSEAVIEGTKIIAHPYELRYGKVVTRKKGRRFGFSEGRVVVPDKPERATKVQPDTVSQFSPTDAMPSHDVDMTALFAQIDKVNSPKKLKQLAAKTVEKFDKEWGLKPDPEEEFVTFRKSK